MKGGDSTRHIHHFDNFFSNDDNLDIGHSLANVKDISMIGSESKNGFLHKIIDKNGKTFIIKSVRDDRGDNLL